MWCSMSFTKEDEEPRGQDSVPYHVSIALISVVWCTRDARRGGDRPCIAFLPSISTSPICFSTIFFHQNHSVDNRNAICERGYVEGLVEHENMGTAEEEERGRDGERAHAEKETL